ncbi:hypothetical protein OPQ81_008541 [Rhizoctonia solani]|nr:hypothetical protein OPQ81_008541 [Rhizoctonia solani]
METVVTEEWGSIIFGRIRKPSRTTTEWDIEDVLLQLTTLRLNSFHISWGSKAYHGLAELRLNDNFRLSRPEFMNILISSPQLRILEIGRLYERFLEASSPNTPIRLDNLEILALGKVTDNFLGSVLRLIVPGTRPLSLSIMNPYQNGSEFSSMEELQNFVARSNVTRLCANGFAGYSQLAEVLSLMPTVRTLGVDQFMCDAIDDESTLPLILQIDALYVLNSTRSCAFTWSSIEEFTKKHDVRALTLWNYNFRHSGIGKAGEETVPDNLHTICPVPSSLGSH